MQRFMASLALESDQAPHGRFFSYVQLLSSSLQHVPVPLVLSLGALESDSSFSTALLLGSGRNM